MHPAPQILRLRPSGFAQDDTLCKELWREGQHARSFGGNGLAVQASLYLDVDALFLCRHAWRRIWRVRLSYSARRTFGFTDESHGPSPSAGTTPLEQRRFSENRSKTLRRPDACRRVGLL
jgi:hypothetical protein